MKRDTIHKIIFFLFISLTFFFILTSRPTSYRYSSPDKIKQLLADNKSFFKNLAPTVFLSVFKNYFPLEKRVSIILDKDDYDAINERMHQEMQRDFVPFVLVNKIPEERISFFVCSTQEIADAQLKKHGYKIKALVSPGKGVAEKI